MYTSLLVPTDGSPLGEQAVPLAADVARRTGATVHLLTVFDPTMYIPMSPTEARGAMFDASQMQEIQHEHHAQLDARAARLSADGIRAQAHALDGTVVETVLEQAAALGADCIVMATHGHSGFARLRLGSVASAILGRGGVPVLLVSAACSPAPTLADGPVLCTLDGEPYAESIVPHATRLAAALGQPLVLLAVVSGSATVPVAPVGIEALADPDDHEDDRAIRQYLERVAASCPAGTTVRVVRAQDVDDAILAEADRLGASAIAMASHARGGIARFFSPSVTDAVVHQCTRPVLVYHPSDDALPGRDTSPEAGSAK